MRYHGRGIERTNSMSCSGTSDRLATLVLSLDDDGQERESQRGNQSDEADHQESGCREAVSEEGSDAKWTQVEKEIGVKGNGQSAAGERDNCRRK